MNAPTPEPIEIYILPIAVVVELVIAGISYVRAKTGTNGKENLYSSVDPYLQR